MLKLHAYILLRIYILCWKVPNKWTCKPTRSHFFNISKKERAAIFVHRERKSCSCLSSPETPYWTVARKFILDRMLTCWFVSLLHGASIFYDQAGDCRVLSSTVHLNFHPLHRLSSGYFEKLRAFCTQRTHFGPLPAISGVLTYIDVHRPNSDALIFSIACPNFRGGRGKRYWYVRRV